MTDHAGDWAFAPAPRSVRLIRVLEAPIEKVWAYLTDPALRRTWFADGPMEPRAGGRFEMTFRNSELSPAPLPERFAQYEGMTSVSTITRWDPPRAVGYEFGGGEALFELEALEDGRTRLTLTNSGLPDRATMVDVSGGWHAHVGLLQDLLAGREPREFWGEVAAAEAEYQRRIPEDG